MRKTYTENEIEIATKYIWDEIGEYMYKHGVFEKKKKNFFHWQPNYSCGSDFISEFSICSDFGFELVHTSKPHIFNCHKNTTVSICENIIQAAELYVRLFARAHRHIHRFWMPVDMYIYCVQESIGWEQAGDAKRVPMGLSLQATLCGLNIFHRCLSKWMKSQQRFKHLHIF